MLGRRCRVEIDGEPASDFPPACPSQLRLNIQSRVLVKPAKMDPMSEIEGRGVRWPASSSTGWMSHHMHAAMQTTPSLPPRFLISFFFANLELICILEK